MDNGRAADTPAPGENTKKVVVRSFEWFGELAAFSFQIARSGVVPPYEGRELLRQTDEIGAKSLPLVAVAGTAIGVVKSFY